MTVPALPATQAFGTTAPSSWSADVRALLAYMRDTPPTITATATLSLTSGTTLNVDMSAASYSAETGTWVKGTATSTRLDVPDPGLYLVTYVGIVHASSSAGRFFVAPKAFLNGTSTLVSLYAEQLGVMYDTANTLIGGGSFTARIAAGGGLAFDVLQNTGVAQNDTLEFNAVWLSA